MNGNIILLIFIIYFIVLLFISRLTTKNSNFYDLIHLITLGGPTGRVHQLTRISDTTENFSCIKVLSNNIYNEEVCR